ncbi:MAG: KH domain-containing protein [Candidatus Kaiserbacteria bacterium]|nr:KH domain-containing protein [Candidatus Kaiserbacteria bacterium]
MTQEKEEAQFLREIIQRIVDNPDKVTVEHEVDKQGVKLTLNVDSSDMGKVIGAQGRMATAIRTIMHAYGGQHEAKVSVIIEEPEKNEM